MLGGRAAFVRSRRRRSSEARGPAGARRDSEARARNANGRALGASPRDLREARDARQDRRRSCPTGWRSSETILSLDRPRPGGSTLSQAESLLVELPASESLASLYENWAWSCLWKAQILPALEAAERSVELAHQLNSASMVARAGIVMGACLWREWPPQRGFRVAGTRLAGSRCNQRIFLRRQP